MAERISTILSISRLFLIRSDHNEAAHNIPPESPDTVTKKSPDAVVKKEEDKNVEKIEVSSTAQLSSTDALFLKIDAELKKFKEEESTPLKVNPRKLRKAITFGTSRGITHRAR